MAPLHPYPALHVTLRSLGGEKPSGNSTCKNWTRLPMACVPRQMWEVVTAPSPAGLHRARSGSSILTIWSASFRPASTSRIFPLLWSEAPDKHNSPLRAWELLDSKHMTYDVPCTVGREKQPMLNFQPHPLVHSFHIQSRVPALRVDSNSIAFATSVDFVQYSVSYCANSAFWPSMLCSAPSKPTRARVYSNIPVSVTKAYRGAVTSNHTMAIQLFLRLETIFGMRHKIWGTRAGVVELKSNWRTLVRLDRPR
jgi:hypothetical protein